MVTTPTDEPFVFEELIDGSRERRIELLGSVEDVELDHFVQGHSDSVHPFQGEQHFVSSSVQRVKRCPDVFVDELLGSVALLEELTTAFSIPTETQVGHVSDDLTVPFEWSD